MMLSPCLQRIQRCLAYLLLSALSLHAGDNGLMLNQGIVYLVLASQQDIVCALERIEQRSNTIITHPHTIDPDDVRFIRILSNPDDTLEGGLLLASQTAEGETIVKQRLAELDPKTRAHVARLMDKIVENIAQLSISLKGRMVHHPSGGIESWKFQMHQGLFDACKNLAILCRQQQPVFINSRKLFTIGLGMGIYIIWQYFSFSCQAQTRTNDTQPTNDTLPDPFAPFHAVD